MASDLPSEFDVIVLGTGLPESILAAAFSRNGYKVLHLDRNDYYSSNWASFNVEGVEKWKIKYEGANQHNNTEDRTISLEQKDGEKVIDVPQFSTDISKITTQYHIAEEDAVNTDPTDEEKNISTEQQKECEEESTDVVSSSPDTGSKVSSASATSHTAVSAAHSQTTCKDQFEDKQEDGQHSEISEKHSKEQKCSQPAHKIWTATEIRDNWRRFNLDLAPKVLYCSGHMVELLIVSDVAKYCEFRTVSQILTLLNGQLEKVPCSRADVFGSKKVSMLEKRLLMKFLTFCAEYEKHADQYQDYIGKPFSEFLTFKKLTPNTHHFVFHSIAMATDTTTTEEGLKKTQHFLQSLGRYGNTAFLFPLYGSGEIPQGFCRLCAVFGGVYCLHMSASHFITDQENKCCAIHTTEGQRIECKHLILGPSYIPEEFLDLTDSKSTICRAVLITNKSILPSENQELSMMHLLPDDDPSRAVTVLELPPSSMVCPRDSFVVHLTRKGNGDPEAEFSSIIKSLFKGSTQADDAPCILWSLFFSQKDQSDIHPSSSAPSNVHLLPGPGVEIDMDSIVEHARNIWEKICPDEDFLPKPPNPEDIIYVDDAETKVGEGTENAFEDAEETSKSEESSKSEEHDEGGADDKGGKEEDKGTNERSDSGCQDDQNSGSRGSGHSQNTKSNPDQKSESGGTGDEQTEKDLQCKLEQTSIS